MTDQEYVVSSAKELLDILREHGASQEPIEGGQHEGLMDKRFIAKVLHDDEQLLFYAEDAVLANKIYDDLF